MGHEGYSGLSTKAKPFGQTTDFSPGGGKHNPKTVSLVKATQHLKKQFSMETINAALISIPTAYLFGGMVLALILYKAVPKS